MSHVDEKVNKKGCLSKSIEVSDNPQHSSRTVTIVDLASTGQPEPITRTTSTISTLPDNVLLEIFDLYLDRNPWIRSSTGESRVPQGPDLWHTLVHVCRHWRCVVTASPRRLNLRLLCTEKRPVKRNVWPDLPIIIHARIPESQRSRSQAMKIIIATLKQQHNRVCQITITDIPNLLLKKFAAMKTPFPALTHLMLRPTDESAPILPDSFLEGSAPRLQSLWFDGIPFPALGKLLLSPRHLSELSLDNIPHSGYISPDALVTSLSGLTRLRRLVLKFQYPRSRAVRERRVPPSLTRVVLPSLFILHFKGDSEYLEDMLSRMDAPLHVHIKINFFNQLVFDTPLLRNLVERAETFKVFHRAEISFSDYSVGFALSQKHGSAETKVLELKISCKPFDWQFSSIAQVIVSGIPPLPTLERLELRSYHLLKLWQDDLENAQWLELLRPFASVKDLVLCGQFIRLVAPVLGELIGEGVAEELPALQNVFVEDVWLSGYPSWQKAIGQFITARQISGHPVAVHRVESDW